MTQIILTPEQAKLYHDANSCVPVCDSQGKLLCILEPEHSAAFIAEQKRRAASSGPRYSGDDIQEMFRFLEDAWAKEGGFDDKRMRQLIDQFDSQSTRVA